jgi:hypothetical protein
MSHRAGLVTALLTLVLVGCGSAPPVREPPPPPRVTRPAPPPPSRPEPPSVQIQPYREPAPAVMRPSFGPAVRSLLATAEAQTSRGNLSGAGATLERALRIEPRNAHLWNRLAHLRMTQKRHGEAAELAQKSNALAGADRDLQRDNWQLIAAARGAVGDLAGARAARHKAESLH